MNDERAFEPDHRHLIRKDLWGLAEACAAILNLREDYVLIGRKEYRSFRNLLDEVRALRPGKLKIILNDEDQREYVEAKAFISCAHTMGYSIPTPFKVLLKGIKRKTEAVVIKRIKAILERINDLGWEATDIQYGGKKEIGKYLCENKPELFRNEGIFNEAWKKASKERLVQVQDIDDYRSAK